MLVVDGNCTGAVRSGLQSNWPGLPGRVLRLTALLLFRDAVHGAQTVVYCAVLDDRSAVERRLCGRLVVDCRPVDVRHRPGTNYRDADRLWQLASGICARVDDAPTRVTMATKPAAAAAAVTAD